MKYVFSSFGTGQQHAIKTRDLNEHGFLRTGAIRSSLCLLETQYLIYRDLTRSRLLVYLKRNPPYLQNELLAQNANTGEWVTIRKAEKFLPESAVILKKLGRLQISEEFCIETLSVGENAQSFFTNVHPDQIPVAQAVLQELQVLNEKGIKIGEPNFHHFVYNEHSGKAHAIHFASAFTKESWLETAMGTEQEYDQMVQNENFAVIQSLKEFISSLKRDQYEQDGEKVNLRRIPC
jgi:hypothetical protein